MRKLCLAAGGFTFATALCIWILPANLIVPALVLSLLLSAALLFALKLIIRKENIKYLCTVISIFLAFSFIGFFRFGLLYSFTISEANEYVSKTDTITGICTDYPSSYSNSDSVTIKLSYPLSCKISLSGGKGSFEGIRPGDEIRAGVKFYSAGKINNEETDSNYSKGIFLKAVLKSGLTVLRPGNPPLSYYPKMISASIKAKALALFPEETASFMKALLTGDKTELYKNERLYYSLQTAGLLHMAAVSGMHVSFLAGAVSLLLGKRRRAGIISSILIVAFMAITGFTPSVTRAGIMQLFVLLAPVFGAEPDMPTSMSASLFPILLFNPYALASVSFQLSFGAMAGIIFITPRLHTAMVGDNNHRRSLYRSAAATVSAFLGAMCFTLPISIINFGFIPLYSVFTNFLCIPMLSAAFTLGYITLLISLFSPALAGAIGKAVGILPYAVSKISEFTMHLPLSSVYAGSGAIIIWLIICALLIAAEILTDKRRRLSPIIKTAIASGIWITSLIICLLIQFGGKPQTAFFAVDVGQGQSLALISDSGSVVIDCGTSSMGINAGDKTASVLMKKGVYRINSLILTHLHADHANGVERLLERIDTENVILPENYENSEWSDIIIDACNAFDIKLTYVDTLYSLTSNEYELKLYPVCQTGDENERGLFISGNILSGGSFLVTGDAGADTEKAFIEKYGKIKADLLVVGHHGSNTSSCTEFLDAVSPVYAIISVGYNNYGHPSDKVIGRLLDRGISVYRTDDKKGFGNDGTVKFLFK